jgi:phage terminase large subunit
VNKQQLRAKIARQQLSRQAAFANMNILATCFQQQRDFINSPSKRKALCCNRRSGKSFSIALYMIDQAIKTPRGKFLYIGLTNESAKGAMWTDIFETIILKYKINSLVTFKETALEIKFQNGATIFLRGMDATPKQMNRVRGQKYTLIAIDEAQNFTQDLNQLINSVLDMTLAQNSESVLCICGTPGSQLGEHYWWKIM